jgi:hypothetical protein
MRSRSMQMTESELKMRYEKVKLTANPDVGY